MADDKMPFIKWFPTDWRSDAELRMCGLAARGLWFEMLMIMHEAEPRGDLRVNGKQIGAPQLANLAGGSPREAEKLLAELEGNGVFDRDPDGTIFSRRMRRERERSEIAKENGGKGGRPPKGKQKANQTESQSETKTETKTESRQKPLEARGQRLEARNQEDLRQPDTVPRAHGPTDDEAAAGLIAAFDDAQAEVWGDLRRQQPAGKDLVTAHRWLRQGLDPQQAQAAFREIFEGLRERERPIPRSLAFIDTDIADRIGQARDLANSPEAVFGKHVGWYPKLASWYERRQWVRSNWGPAPGEEGCQVPAGAFEAWKRWAAMKGLEAA